MIELEVFLHEICRSLVNIIAYKFGYRWDLFHVANGTQTCGCERLKYFDALVLLVLWETLLPQNLIEFIDDEDWSISVEFLYRIVKDSPSCLIYLISLPLAPTCILNPIHFIFLHLLFNVEQVCFAFFEDFIALWGLWIGVSLNHDIAFFVFDDG